MLQHPVDSVPNTRKISNPVTSYTYDSFGNVLTMTDAMGKKETYTYNTLGSLKSKTDRNGVTTSYGYDALGRVLQTVTSLGDVLSYTYAMTGQVLTEQNNNQKTSYAYDELGRVISVSEEELSIVEVPTACTVILDPNGGTVDETEIAAWSGTEVTLPAPERKGYTFADWKPHRRRFGQISCKCQT